MDVDREAPVIASSESEISAPPEIVWDTIADFESWPSWNSDVKSVSIEGPVEPGTQFKWKAGPGSLTSTLLQTERPRSLGWRGKTMGIDGIHVWSFEPRDGGTLVRTEESWSGLPPRLMSGRMRKLLQRSLDTGLAYLKTEAERRAAT